ncbi:MAG: copper chaperone PCu(A)C [Gallionella sp.]
MRGMLQTCLFFTAWLTSGSVFASDITIENAWARATAPGQDVASVELSITSNAAASLTGVTSRVCSTVELHRMTHEDGMMKMRQVDSINLDAGKTLNLSEAGYHLMLIGLKEPLKAGEHLPLVLTIRRDNSRVDHVNVTAEVKGLTENGGATPEHTREHHH